MAKRSSKLCMKQIFRCVKTLMQRSRSSARRHSESATCGLQLLDPAATTAHAPAAAAAAVEEHRHFPAPSSSNGGPVQGTMPQTASSEQLLHTLQMEREGRRTKLTGCPQLEQREGQQEVLQEEGQQQRPEKREPQSPAQALSHRHHHDDSSSSSDGDSGRTSTCASSRSSVPTEDLEETLVPPRTLGDDEEEDGPVSAPRTPGDEEGLGFWCCNELDFMDEWTIARGDLSLEQVVTTSEKETVYRGYWHGSVTVHTRSARTDEEYRDFVSEVQTLCRIRHEKIQLFMGICLDLKPESLAIVVDQMKGDTLYNTIYKDRHRYDYQSTMGVLNQVAQGMEYLHAKNIVHPMLTSKSIGVHRGRACITMWAPASITSRPTTVCEMVYVPPEVLRTMIPNRDGSLSLSESNSFESNVYSFGTVAYELATMERPYKSLPIVPFIWEVGNGHFQSLAPIGSWKLRGVVASCWTSAPEERATFRDIVENIERNMTPNSPRPYAGDVKSAFSFSEPSQLQRLGI